MDTRQKVIRVAIAAAELERFKTEQQQKIAQAEAEKTRLLADAEAYEIEKISKAIAGSPGYIQLQALQTLASISKDPASKVYFLNGSSPTPLPLMHMGELDGAKLSTGNASNGSGGAAKSKPEKLAGRTK